MKVNLIYERHEVPKLPKLNEYHEVTNYYITYRHSLMYKGIIPLVKTDDNTWIAINNNGVITETQTLKSMFQNARIIAYREIEHTKEILSLE